ncbi:MAG: hypothetical protein H7287_14010 [Thermoleophilia bacterium]|nr:hypothetical protein [Thermoleophilia bacterium]
MRRDQLEHVLRAAMALSDQEDFVVIGSQAILGSVAAPPAEIMTSIEADLYPRDRPDLADNIDGAIGDGSMFQDTFGYYAHGVGPETAVAPRGWEDRLVPLVNENTKGATGWCMEPHDLVIAKLAAGRDKDIAYARVLIAHGVVRPDELHARLGLLDARPELIEFIRSTLRSITPA